MPLRQSLLAIMLFLAVPTNASTSTDATASAHPHQGKVTPFLPGDPHVSLDDKAMTVLNSNQPYLTQIQSGSSGRGLVVQDIHATTDVVWGRILDYNHYAEMVPKTLESENYQVVHQSSSSSSSSDENDISNTTLSDNHPPTGRKTIYTRMKVGFPMVKLQFFVKHDYYPELHSLTWTLDYTKKSDFDDSCGYWYVIPHPEKPDDWTRVYYSVDVSMYDWVPRFVVNFMSKQALTEATGWVKKHSELEYAKLPQQPKVAANGGSSGTPHEAVSNNEAPTQPPQQEQLTAKRKRRRWFGPPNSEKELSTNQKQKQDEDNESMASGDTCSSSSSFSDSDNEENEERSMDTHPVMIESSDTDTLVKITPATMGMARYLLMTSVCALAMYNVHVYLSQQ
jgi:Polyketide cyclase / dehydrase and lipid transport